MYVLRVIILRTQIFWGENFMNMKGIMTGVGIGMAVGGASAYLKGAMAGSVMKRKAKKSVDSGKQSERLSVSNQLIVASAVPKRRAPIRVAIFSIVYSICF